MSKDIKKEPTPTEIIARAFMDEVSSEKYPFARARIEDERDYTDHYGRVLMPDAQKKGDLVVMVLTIDGGNKKYATAAKEKIDQIAIKYGVRSDYWGDGVWDSFSPESASLKGNGQEIFTSRLTTYYSLGEDPEEK